MLKLAKRKFLSLNHYFTRLSTKRFLKPDEKIPKVQLLNNDIEVYSDTLKKNGVIKISGLFIDEANYIEKEYFSKLENDDNITQWYKNNKNERSAKNGRVVNLNISFNDQNLKKLFFNEDLLGIVYNYYKRQPYYRNLPALTKVAFTEKHGIDIQGKFHLDGGMNQISFMLLVNDITESDTHMQYALGANRYKVPFDIDRFSWKDDMIMKKFKIYDLVGKKGDIFIFDAGNGYHRAVYKKDSVRKILHLNLTTGHSLVGHKEHENANFDFIANEKSYVKESIKMLLD